MKIEGNTILITGGGSGIGLAMALEFKKLGNEVIVSGRSEDKLAEARAKGLHTFNADMKNLESLQDLASLATTKFPKLNVLINNAGIMKNEKLTARDNSKTAVETVSTNLVGPIVLTNALLPHLKKQESAAIINVTSGLAFTPLVMTPTYSATKAALHSYTESLRYQLKDTRIEVKELVPPYVQTMLMGERQKSDENAMPLEEFIAEVFFILRENPKIDEILVKRVLPQRTAAYGGAEKYQETFKGMNDRLMAARKQEWEAL
jgi:uncharacterized oxidoreductase